MYYLSTRDTFVLYSTFFFFFNDTATTEIYTLSLHDALPISLATADPRVARRQGVAHVPEDRLRTGTAPRSEEHTSELQSHVNLVCRLLLEKKKKNKQKQSKHHKLTIN